MVDISAAKTDPTAPLDKACFLGCGISTGYRTAVNTAKVETGSICSSFVMEVAVIMGELAVIMGCKVADAFQTTDKDKFSKTKAFGSSDCINPQDFSKPSRKHSLRCQMGGADYSFKPIGNMKGVRAALQATHKGRGRGWGSGQRVSVVVGLAASGEEIVTCLFHLVTGHTSPLEDRRVESFSKLVSEYMTKNM